MIVQVLAAYARATVRVCIVAPTHDTSVRYVVWEEVAEPVDIVGRSPRFLSVSIQTMNGDDAKSATLERNGKGGVNR